MSRIPITTAKKISKDYKYDQVIIYARKVGNDGIEWVTTYGINKAHCNAAAKIGNVLRNKMVIIDEQKELIKQLREELNRVKNDIP